MQCAKIGINTNTKGLKHGGSRKNVPADPRFHPTHKVSFKLSLLIQIFVVAKYCEPPDLLITCLNKIKEAISRALTCCRNVSERCLFHPLHGKCPLDPCVKVHERSK